MKNLNKTGLSLSQAQSISNLCNQRANDINNIISMVNNFSRTIEYNGKELIETTPYKIPTNIKELLIEKAKLHACQAFIMENVKAKTEWMEQIKKRKFDTTLEAPKRPEYLVAEFESEVDENWGWSQLSTTEYNEYLEVEAYASHIGQFIHKNGKLDTLRKQLPTIKQLEWMEIEKDKKIPVKVQIIHTQDELLELHNTLSAEHRKYEQKVNYFKAKVKNLVTEKNAEIARNNANKQSEITKINDKLRSEYQIALDKYNEQILKEKQEFEEKRQNEMKEVSALRIDVDKRFQEVIDSYLKTIE